MTTTTKLSMIASAVMTEYLRVPIDIGDAIDVFDGVEEPETYVAQPIIFDYPDPEWIPPSTTTASLR